MRKSTAPKKPANQEAYRLLKRHAAGMRAVLATARKKSA